MKNIQILSDELISQIAAGEVIERPASVVKELLENSLDAGASLVRIEIEEGGMKKIRVMDNGVGIAPEEARLAFKRHATSKIRSVEDLFTIKSLGFRGEALASIASVARVVLTSAQEGARGGVRLEVDGGKEVSFEETVCPAGTDISVLGLFRHTPARKKYMKTERTEYGRIFDLVTQVALSNPDVAIKLMRDGKEVLDLPASSDLKDRIRLLFGGTTANALVPLRYEQSNLIVNGFVGKPELSRASKKYQFIFINGRAIDSRLLTAAVKEGFHSLLMHEKYPWFLLDIQMDPNLVDVNVHPRKLEVKFVNQQEMFRVIRGAVHHALERSMLSPVVDENEGPAPFLKARPQFKLPERSVQSTRDFAPAQELFEIKGLTMRPVAQIAHAYIVAESEEGMVLIDQHAAHERIRYARLMEALEKEQPKQQPLLTPLELELGADSARLLTDYLEDFKALGFDIEAFGGQTFLLRAVPVGIEKRDPEAVVHEIIADVTQEWKQNHVKNLREFLLTYTACRGAIKFGDSLTMPEMQALIRDMEDTEHCTHCPHGRPAILTLTFDHLETLFKRKNF